MKIITFTQVERLGLGYECSEPGNQSGNYVRVGTAQDLLRAAELYQTALEKLMADMPLEAKCCLPTAVAVVAARDHGAKIIAAAKAAV